MTSNVCVSRSRKRYECRVFSVSPEVAGVLGPLVTAKPCRCDKSRYYDANGGMPAIIWSSGSCR